jgi:hypothetical protein
MEQIDGTIISNRLATTMLDAIKDVKENTTSFDIFTDEAIIYALIRYAKNYKLTAKKERIIYLYEKAFFFQYGIDCNVVGITYRKNTNRYTVHVFKAKPMF